MRTRLPEFMVPARIVVLPRLPLTPNGKIDRNALPGPAEPEENPGRPVTATGYVARANETEERLAAIWRDLLDQPRIGVHDGFFDLGGHSLLATKLIFRIREAFDVDLPLPVLFDRQPTVAGLAELLSGTGAPSGAGPRLDLAAEVVLPEEIRPRPGAHVHSVRHPQHVLLTGATGFVGAFLAEELLRTTEATLHCLVRAVSAEQGYERIRAALAGYGVWDEAFAGRIIAVPGTLSRPHFGLGLPHWQHLAATVDVIYHCGADVNFLQPYHSLKPTNVLGTEEVLRLACDGSVKPVHFVSTTYVFSRSSYPPGTRFTEEMAPVHDVTTTIGYGPTKWVSEQLVLEAGRRGLPVYVYRCGRVAGHSRTGACQTHDFVWQVIKAMVEMGAAPVLDLSIDLTPVDYVVRALVHLSRQPELRGPPSTWWRTTGSPRPSCWPGWRRTGTAGSGSPSTNGAAGSWPGPSRTRAAAALAPFLSGRLAQDQFSDGEFDHRTVDRGLAGSDITCPPIDDRLLRTYFDHFTTIGYLPAPRPPAFAAGRSPAPVAGRPADGRDRPMRAIRIHETGSPEVLRLEEIDIPTPGPGELLIRVGVAGVNFTDVMARQGVYLSQESVPVLPATLGTEVAGVVTAGGPGAPAELVGKRVVAFVHGGYAEYAVARPGLVTELPAGIDLAEATSYLVQGVTAGQLLRDCGRLEPGSRYWSTRPPVESGPRGAAGEDLRCRHRRRHRGFGGETQAGHGVGRRRRHRLHGAHLARGGARRDRRPRGRHRARRRRRQRGRAEPVLPGPVRPPRGVRGVQQPARGVRRIRSSCTATNRLSGTG